MALDQTQNRSTANSVQNTTFTDLSMTNYPKVIDTRANNKNMQGFVNIQDAGAGTPTDKLYNYAEHINALADAVMAIQRVLGINPHLDVNGQANAKNTMGGRVEVLENPNRLDGRYGGTGWITGQTIVSHTHSGANGHPSKINLASEVQGLLGKSNIDTAFATGLTAADLAMGPLNSIKLTDNLNDKLSLSKGGEVQGGLGTVGLFWNRLYREWNSGTVPTGSGTVISTTDTASQKAIRCSGKTYMPYIWSALMNFEYGKYVLGIRARINNKVSENVISIQSLYIENGAWASKDTLLLKGTDFEQVNQWQMFYAVLDVRNNTVGAAPMLDVAKLVTQTDVDVDFDYAFITPVHPAIFNK